METLQTILTILIVIDAIALCAVILLQEGKDAGLGAIAGGAGYSNDSYVKRNQRHTPEGKRRTATIICTILFMALALAINIVGKYI